MKKDENGKIYEKRKRDGNGKILETKKLYISGGIAN